MLRSAEGLLEGLRRLEILHLVLRERVIFSRLGDLRLPSTIVGRHTLVRELVLERLGSAQQSLSGIWVEHEGAKDRAKCLVKSTPPTMITTFKVRLFG